MSVIVILVLIQLLIRLWPVSAPLLPISQSLEATDVSGFIESVEVTRQPMASIPVAAQKPVIPPVEPVERDAELPDLLDFLIFLEAYQHESTNLPIQGSDGEIEPNPDRLASPVRIVEPEVDFTLPEKIRGKIRVEFTLVVDMNGKVDAVKVERLDLPEFVEPSIDFTDLESELKNASFRAAMQWTFRPAEKNQMPVKSIFRSSFRF